MADAGAARRRRVPAHQRGSRRHRAPVPRGARAGDRVRRRHVARRPRGGAVRRRLRRPVADEPRARGQRARTSTAACRPGVTREQLNAELKGTGPVLPDRPGRQRDASAAWPRRARRAPTPCATARCARTCSGLTVVTADGRIIRTGGRARKSSAGYDLTRLFVGTEGTLGIITEIQLRLYGMPEADLAAVCQFPDLESAVDTVIVAMQIGIPVARIELLDDVQMDACIRYSKLEGFEVEPTLFFEFHGTTAGVAGAGRDDAGDRRRARRQRLRVGDRGRGAHRGCGRRGTTPTTPRWRCRPGKQAFATDACVPISRLADCVLETRADVDATGLIAPIVGHVGDGNFHLCCSVRPERRRRAREGRGARPARQPCARSRWAARAPASTASACTSSTRWSPSTARRSSSCRRSSARSIRATS